MAPDAQTQIALAAIGVASVAVTALALSLKAVLRLRSHKLNVDAEVRAEIDHVLNGFAQIVIHALIHAERGDYHAAIEGIERWSLEHPSKRG